MSMQNVIPSKYESAIQHALVTGNRLLLNRLELELIRIFNIKPSNALPRAKIKAMGIVEINHKLLVLWHDDLLGKCAECDGDGEINAYGKNKTFTVDCPVCDGTGDGDDVDDVDPDKITITDIDGNVVDCDLDMNEFEIFESNCPLIAYNREQSELKKALFEQCAK